MALVEGTIYAYLSRRNRSQLKVQVKLNGYGTSGIMSSPSGENFCLKEGTVYCYQIGRICLWLKGSELSVVTFENKSTRIFTIEGTNYSPNGRICFKSQWNDLSIVRVE